MIEAQKKYRYPGIRSFSKEEEKIFFGRSADTENIYASIHLNPVTTVFGQSGIGKTSVINAGVITRFEKYNTESKTNNFTIIRVETGNYIPVKDEPVHKTLVDIIAEKCFANSTGATPPSVFSDIDIKQNLWLQFKLQQRTNTPVVLIFDQAEQLFTFPTQDFNLFLSNLKLLTSKYVPDEIRSLAEKATEDDLPEKLFNHLYVPLEIKLVFVIRSDKLQLLSRLKNILPAILQNCYEILPFNLSKAREAIVAPSQFEGGDNYTPKFEITEGAITRILDILSSKIGILDNPNEAIIEPYYLQIICQHIEREIVKGRENIQVYDKDLPLNLTDIVGEYYLNCIKNLDIPEAEKNKVQDFIELKMIYEPDNRRITLDKAMIVSDKHYTISEAVLNELVKNRLLTAEKNISGEELFKLTHDCLVEPILEIKRKRSDEYARIKQQGDLLVNQLKYDEAIALYSNCIKNADSLNANFSDILKARGNVYYLQKQYKLSNQDYLDALASDPADFLTLYYIGLNYFYLADDDNAEIYLEKAARNTGYSATIYNEAGVLYYNSKLIQWSEKYYLKAIKADPLYSTSYYNLGLLYRVQQQHDKAISYLDEALKLDPNSADTYNELGNLYLNKNDYANAQKNYETATSLDPKYYYAWYNLGDIEYNNKNYDGAISYYKKAIDANNKYIDAYLKIATVFSVTKDFKGIINYINTLLEIEPQSPEAYAWLGYAYINLHEFDNALKNLNVAVSITSTANAYYNVGYAYQETGNMEEAEKNYRKALEIDQDYLGAAENLASLLINQKRNTETATLLEKYVSAGKTTLRMFYLLGQSYMNTNELNKAKDCFLKIVNEVYDFSSYLFLADIEKEWKQYDEALSYYNKILETEPLNTTATEYAGTLLYDQSRFEEALKYYTKLTELLPDSAYAYNLLGNCYYQLKVYASAKENYYKAVEKDSSFYHSIYNLGLTAENMEMHDEAIKFFTKAIELNKDYEAAYKSLSDVFIAQKNYKEAARQLEILAEKQPTAANYMAVAYIYFDTIHDNIKAKEFALLAAGIDKNSDAAYSLAGLAEFNEGKEDAALQDFNQALAINTQNADTYNGIGRIKIAQNNYEDALGYFETAIKLDPGFTDAYNNLGHCYFNMNPYKKAEEMFTKSIEADHANFYAITNLAESQFYLEKYSDAEKNIKQALLVNPDYDDAYYVQSLLLQQAGKKQEALESIKTCLALNPDHAKAAEQLKLLEEEMVR